MRGSDLIKLIQDKGLEDFEILAMTSKAIGTGWGLEVSTFKLKGLGDIGHSDKVAFIEAEKEE